MADAYGGIPLRNWLKDGIDRLLRMGAESEAHEFASAYDDCLWRVATASREDLAELIAGAWSVYNNLPVPLLVVAARLYGAESAGDPAAVEAALQVITPHCDPLEETGATSGIAALASKLGGA
jgi:hypothetical protein